MHVQFLVLWLTDPGFFAWLYFLHWKMMVVYFLCNIGGVFKSARGIKPMQEA